MVEMASLTSCGTQGSVSIYLSLFFLYKMSFMFFKVHSCSKVLVSFCILSYLCVPCETCALGFQTSFKQML